MKIKEILLISTILILCIFFVGCVSQKNPQPTQPDNAITETINEEQQSTEPTVEHSFQEQIETMGTNEAVITTEPEVTESTDNAQTEATQAVPEETVPENTYNDNHNGSGTMLPDDEF